MVDIRRVLKKIESTPDVKLRKIMGKDYIDTTGFCSQKQELKNYKGILDCMEQNMGKSSFNRLIKWIRNNPKKVKKL